MKDATGELSMTAVAVVAIAAIALIFQRFIWPQIQASIARSTYCSSAYACTCGTDSTCNCYYTQNDGNQGSIKCPNNGTSSTTV